MTWITHTLLPKHTKGNNIKQFLSKLDRVLILDRVSGKDVYLQHTFSLQGTAVDCGDFEHIQVTWTKKKTICVKAWRLEKDQKKLTRFSCVHKCLCKHVSQHFVWASVGGREGRKRRRKRERERMMHRGWQAERLQCRWEEKEEEEKADNSTTTKKEARDKNGAKPQETICWRQSRSFSREQLTQDMVWRLWSPRRTLLPAIVACSSCSGLWTNTVHPAKKESTQHQMNKKTI